eukprot:5726394-Heterocapsa_arctica.AAC.1
MGWDDLIEGEAFVDPDFWVTKPYLHVAMAVPVLLACACLRSLALEHRFTFMCDRCILFTNHLKQSNLESLVGLASSNWFAAVC